MMIPHHHFKSSLQPFDRLTLDVFSLSIETMTQHCNDYFYCFLVSFKRRKFYLWVKPTAARPPHSSLLFNLNSEKIFLLSTVTWKRSFQVSFGFF